MYEHFDVDMHSLYLCDAYVLSHINMQEYKLDLAYLLRILLSMDLPFVALFILIRFLARDRERRETPSIAS